MSRNAPRRQVRYRWRLRELMAARGMFSTTDLVPLLADRDVALSASQVHRLVTGTPERLSLPVLAALCDILDVEPGALIQTEATAVTAARGTGTHSGRSAAPAAPGAGPAPVWDGGRKGSRPATLDLAGRRPTRALVDPGLTSPNGSKAATGRAPAPEVPDGGHREPS